MPKVLKSRLHVVPVLLRALDVLELLSRTNAPLRMDEIADTTGVSRTTTYRILQTFVHRGYLAHDLEGKYSLSKSIDMTTILRWHATAADAESAQKSRVT